MDRGCSFPTVFSGSKLRFQSYKDIILASNNEGTSTCIACMNFQQWATPIDFMFATVLVSLYWNSGVLKRYLEPIFQAITLTIHLNCTFSNAIRSTSLLKRAFNYVKAGVLMEKERVDTEELKGVFSWTYNVRFGYQQCAPEGCPPRPRQACRP